MYVFFKTADLPAEINFFMTLGAPYITECLRHFLPTHPSEQFLRTTILIFTPCVLASPFVKYADTTRMRLHLFEGFKKVTANTTPPHKPTLSLYLAFLGLL
jgi:hypothetical protein